MQGISPESSMSRGIVIISATTVRGRIRLHPRDQCPTWRTAKGRRQIASGRSQDARTIAGNTDGRPGHLVIQSRGAPFFSKEWSRALQREALESRRVTTPLAPQRGIKRALVTSGSPPIASVRRRGAFDAMGHNLPLAPQKTAKSRLHQDCSCTAAQSLSDEACAFNPR
jgi:hypothetical protein